MEQNYPKEKQGQLEFLLIICIWSTLTILMVRIFNALNLLHIKELTARVDVYFAIAYLPLMTGRVLLKVIQNKFLKCNTILGIHDFRIELVIALFIYITTVVLASI